MEQPKDLSLRHGESISPVRMDAVKEETMDHYFSLLKDTLDEHNLRDKPEQIYNVDESGLPLDPKAPNIIVRITGDVQSHHQGVLPVDQVLEMISPQI